MHASRPRGAAADPPSAAAPALGRPGGGACPPPGRGVPRPTPRGGCARLGAARRRAHVPTSPAGGASAGPISKWPAATRAGVAAPRSATPRPAASKRSSSVRARLDRREELGDAEARRAAEPRRQRRLGQRGLEHLGQQHDAGQQRPAREVAGERRVVAAICSVRTLPLTPRSAALRAPAPRRAAPAGRAGSLPVASRGSAVARTTRRGRKAASTRCRSAEQALRATGPARRRRRSAAPRRRHSRGGSQKAPSATPAIAFRWKFRCASELRLPAMLIRSLERPSRRKWRRVDELEHVGQRRRLGHVAAADDHLLAVACEPQVAEGAPFGTFGGAPRRHLAGLGAAVDLQQRRAERGLGAAASCGDSGAVAQTSRSTGGSAMPASSRSSGGTASSPAAAAAARGPARAAMSAG